MAATDAQTVELHDRTGLSVQYFRAADDDTAEFEIERTAGYEVVETWGTVLQLTSTLLTGCTDPSAGRSEVAVRNRLSERYALTSRCQYQWL